MLELHAKLGARLQEARGQLADQASYRFNEAALHCGVALLDAYQRVKGERQVIDYADIECHAWELVSVSDHAVYMHYKLDARYRHILLDEFQDTNPLQWLTLESWLEAAAAADMRPTVFMVGDPKQSIYRFRRAETRLFGQATRYLQDEFGACEAAAGRVAPLPAAGDRYREPPVLRRGRVQGLRNACCALPRQARPCGGAATGAGRRRARGGSRHGLDLRDPLERPLADAEDHRREREAEMLVGKSRRSTASGKSQPT